MLSTGWQEEYKRKFVSFDEAVKVVKSGDHVVMAQPEALSLGLGLVSRADELTGVSIMGGGGSDLPMYDPSWYDVYPDTFQLETSYVLPLVRELVSQRRSDFTVSGLAYPIP